MFFKAFFNGLSFILKGLITFNLYDRDIFNDIIIIMQIRKMADYNLLLVAIPEDTLKSEPTSQNNEMNTLL